MKKKPLPSPITVLALIFLLSIFACQEEENKPEENILDFFPLITGNEWTYTVEGIQEDGQVSSVSEEKWQVNPSLFMDMYEVTLDGDSYIGYRVFYYEDKHTINDIIGTCVSTDYLELSNDTLVFVASDNISILRERWINGGLVKVNTSFGALDCICIKTVFHFNEIQEEYMYFARNIGLCLIKWEYIYTDQDGNPYTGFTWRSTLIDHNIQ